MTSIETEVSSVERFILPNESLFTSVKSDKFKLPFELLDYILKYDHTDEICNSEGDPIVVAVSVLIWTCVSHYNYIKNNIQRYIKNNIYLITYNGGFIYNFKSIKLIKRAYHDSDEVAYESIKFSKYPCNIYKSHYNHDDLEFDKNTNKFKFMIEKFSIYSAYYINLRWITNNSYFMYGYNDTQETVIRYKYYDDKLWLLDKISVPGLSDIGIDWDMKPGGKYGILSMRLSGMVSILFDNFIEYQKTGKVTDVTYYKERYFSSSKTKTIKYNYNTIKIILWYVNYYKDIHKFINIELIKLGK